MGYDIYELNSKKYRKFKSDLLLLKSSNPEDDLISINVRGRGRNEGFRIPDGLKVIDIIVTSKYEMDKIFANNSLKSGYYVRFYGFEEEHSSFDTSFSVNNRSLNSYMASDYISPSTQTISSNSNDKNNNFSLFDVDETDIVGKWILVSITEIEAVGLKTKSLKGDEKTFLSLRNDKTFEDSINNESGHYSYSYPFLYLKTEFKITEYHVKALSHNTLELVDTYNRILKFIRDTVF